MWSEGGSGVRVIERGGLCRKGGGALRGPVDKVRVDNLFGLNPKGGQNDCLLPKRPRTFEDE